jgi:hypothetical protein
MPEPGFSQVDVALNTAENFVVDHIFVAKLQDGLAFLLERLVREPLVFG